MHQHYLSVDLWIHLHWNALSSRPAHLLVVVCWCSSMLPLDSLSLSSYLHSLHCLQLWCIFYTKIAYFIELSSLVSTLCAALVSILYANIDILLSVSLSIILVKLVLIRVYSFLSVWITALAAHLHGNHLGGIKKMIDACFGCSFFHVIMFWTIFCTVLYMGCLLLFVFICNAV